ncbi:uncharacterized protein LOC128617194 isoform X2 [Ictalurus furcatus]|uniref:uncharacterized protein LOC128617194 isoform X2 n=1 Tax=Ictalurus furcatus TaxID=66913 RepID=UPI0023505AC7|nr:uncharacterized protein LOC128617194 isoform X2 [Ictalurus furcatus]
MNILLKMIPELKHASVRMRDGGRVETIIEHMRREGPNALQVGIFVLCAFGFVIGSLILGYFSYTSFKNNDDSRRALAIQLGHVLCPNITMAIVFIFCGVTDGFFTEAATCSALNGVRILFLLWIALHLKTFEGYHRQLINRLAILLQYTVITVVVYSPLVVEVRYNVNTGWKVILLIFLLLALFLTLLYILYLITTGKCFKHLLFFSY